MVMLASFLQKSFLGADGQFRVFGIAFKGMGISPVVARENLWESEEECFFDHLNILKVKDNICLYCKSIKVKVSMTYVYEE